MSEHNTFAPQEVSTAAYRMVESRSKETNPGIKTGIEELDRYLNPHRPGELRVVLGYTSNYKSGLMNFIARNAARELMKREDYGNRAVITVTWEQSVEEQGIVDISQLAVLDVTKMMRGELTETDWWKLKKAAIDRGCLPWWLVGHSSETQVRRPRLGLTDLAKAIEYIIDVQKITPELIVLDYLQRIRREGNNSNEARLQFMEMIDRCKDMALAYHVPVMLGSQAKRSIKERAWRMPNLDDGQECSNQEQSADSMLSVWMPKQDYPLNHQIEYGELNLTVTPNLLMLGILKQRFGVAPKIIQLHVQPEINEIHAIDTRSPMSPGDKQKLPGIERTDYVRE